MPPCTAGTLHCGRSGGQLPHQTTNVDLKQSWNQWSVVQDIRIVIGKDVPRAQYQISAMSWIWSECIISGWWEYELVPACLCARLVWVEQCPRPQHEIISPPAQLSSTAPAWAATCSHCTSMESLCWAALPRLLHVAFLCSRNQVFDDESIPMYV